MTAPPRSRFRADIEGLRAVAILTVVLYHLTLFRVSGGYIGVDVFFVISGFLITGQLVKTIGADGRQALPAFYARRIKRLLPAASVSLVATVVAWRIWGLATLPRSTATDAVYATFYGLNYRLAHAGTQYFNPLVSPPALQHFWSLAVEEQFYVVWPLLILIAFWHRRDEGRRNLTIALCVIGAISLFLSWDLSNASTSWAFFGLHTRAWELATGALVSLSAHRAERLKPLVATALTWLGLAAIIIATFKYTSTTTYPGLAAVLPVAGAALVIAGGCANPKYGAGLLLNRGPAQVTGRLSYSWYLWHFPIIIIAPFALNHVLVWKDRIGLLVVTFVVAGASYLFVERPFRRRQWQPIRWFTLAVGSAALVAVVAIVAVVFPKSAVGPGPAVAAPRLTGTVSQQEDQIKSAVTAALAATTVPDNLSPNLSHAFSDGPKTSSDCFLGFGGTTNGSCVSGDLTASRTVVLIGDSLAEQWLPALDELGQRNHWRVVLWAKSACSINAEPILNVITGKPYTACLTWRNQLIGRIRALNPQAVIAGNSLYYDYPELTAARVASLTASTMQALAAPGRSLDYLMPDPLPFRDMPSCIATHLTDLTGCTTSTAGATSPAARRAAVGTELTAAGVHVVDPATVMCSATECPSVVGNISVYRDNTHVTATYARFLEPIFESLLPPATSPS